MSRILALVATHTYLIITPPCCINAHRALNNPKCSTGQRFHWLGPWKTLDSTLQIHGKQSSVWALTSPRVIVMFGPTERSLQPWVGVWLLLHLPRCGEAQVLFQKPQWKRSRWVSAKSGIQPAVWAQSARFEHCGENSQHFPVPVWELYYP